MTPLYFLFSYDFLYLPFPLQNLFANFEKSLLERFERLHMSHVYELPTKIMSSHAEEILHTEEDE